MKDKREKALDLLKTYLMFDDEEMQVSNKSTSLDFTILANRCAIFVKRKTGEYVLRITGKGPIKEYKVHLALTAREILLDAVMNNE